MARKIKWPEQEFKLHDLVRLNPEVEVLVLLDAIASKIITQALYVKLPEAGSKMDEWSCSFRLTTQGNGRKRARQNGLKS